MRHAARLPPPPVFNDRRLLLLIAFCKSQSIDHSFGVCVFCLRLTLAHFCRYLYVLDVCCQFASCQAMLAICKSYCKNVSEMHQQLCNNPSKVMQNPSKIDENGAKERSESDLGSKSAPGFQKSGHGFEKWMPFLRHLGDFGRHFGPSWAPRGSPNRAIRRPDAPKVGKIASRKSS